MLHQVCIASSQALPVPDNRPPLENNSVTKAVQETVHLFKEALSKLKVNEAQGYLGSRGFQASSQTDIKPVELGIFRQFPLDETLRQRRDLTPMKVSVPGNLQVYVKGGQLHLPPQNGTLRQSVLERQQSEEVKSGETEECIAPQKLSGNACGHEDFSTDEEDEDLPCQGSSELWPTNSGSQSPSGKSSGTALDGLAQVCLEDSERSTIAPLRGGSGGRLKGSADQGERSGSSEDLDSGPGSDSELCNLHSKSMRWRGGGSKPAVEEGSDVSDEVDGVSSKGSSRKRARGGSGGALDELSPRSLEETSHELPERQKGGTRDGEEGGKGSNESTLQSGQKRKHTDSTESSESVRQAERKSAGVKAGGNKSPRPGADAKGPFHTRGGRASGHGPDGAHFGEKNEHLSDWRRIADGQQTVYECRFCGKRFLVSQALGGHMNRHRVEREEEKAKVSAQARCDGAASLPNSRASSPKLQGASNPSPSTPLNFTESPWGGSYTTSSIPPATSLPSAAVPISSKAFFSTSLPTPSQEKVYSVRSPGSTVTYEAGFEAGFGAGLVALARAGLLVPEAMNALGWQKWEQGAGAEIALQEQEFLANRDGFPGQDRSGPSDRPPLEAKVEQAAFEAGGPRTSVPAVMPVWIDGIRGQRQVFQVENVRGLDKGLYALKPVSASASEPPDMPLPAGANYFPGGNPGRQDTPPEMYEYGFAPETKVDFKNGGFAANPGVAEYNNRRAQECPRWRGSAQPSVSQRATPGLLASTRPAVGTFAPVVGFRAARADALPVTIGARFGGLKVAPHSGEFSSRASPQVFRGFTGTPPQAGIGERPKPARADGEGEASMFAEQGEPGAETQDPTPPQEGISRGGGSSPEIVSPPPELLPNLQPTLSLGRQPSDIYQDFLHSQASGFDKSLGDVSLGGGFDETLNSFTQDHPDWPDYFQGGSVNSGDAFGASE